MGRRGGRSATLVARPAGSHPLAQIGVSPMTLAAACGWSLVRSLLVAWAAWPICKLQVAWLSGSERRQRRLVWMALLIPFLCPELWAGYAWSGFAVRLASTGLWNIFPFSLCSFSPR